MNVVTQINFLRQTPLFADISADDLRAIAKDLRLKVYGSRQHIFRQGDMGDALYLIKSGQVRIYVNSLEGSETTVVLFGRAGELFGELALADDQPRSASAIAACRSELYMLRRSEWIKHVKRCPQIALNFMRILSQRLRYNTRQVDSLASLDVQQRLALKLLDLADDYGIPAEPGTRITTILRQSDLASLIGATRESTNKTLRAFRRHGWVEKDGGALIVRDPIALQALL